MKPPYAIGSVPSLSGHAVAYRWRSLPRVRRHRTSKPQGSSERVLPWQITMDQLIFASLSHTHYWHEVGMLKIPGEQVRDTGIHLKVLIDQVRGRWTENARIPVIKLPLACSTTPTLSQLTKASRRLDMVKAKSTPSFGAATSANHTDRYA